MAYKEFLQQLHEQEWFSRFVKEVLIPGTPSIPTYNPSSDNTERWKYDCAMREGYLECLKNLGVKNG